MKYLYQGREFATPEEVYEYQAAVQAAIIQWCTFDTTTIQWCEEKEEEPRREFQHFSNWQQYARAQGIKIDVLKEDEEGTVLLAEGRANGFMYARFRYCTEMNNNYPKVRAYCFSKEYIREERLSELDRD